MRNVMGKKLSFMQPINHFTDHVIICRVCHNGYVPKKWMSVETVKYLTGDHSCRFVLAELRKWTSNTWQVTAAPVASAAAAFDQLASASESTAAHVWQWRRATDLPSAMTQTRSKATPIWEMLDWFVNYHTCTAICQAHFLVIVMKQ